MDEIISRILKGEGREDDLPTLERLFPNIEGKTICAFGEAFVWPVRSMVRKFKNEFLDYVQKKNLVKAH
jgi:NADH-quinone oxidoreductase subunit F